MIWDDFARAIDRELKEHPQDFLRQRVIAKTMHPNTRGVSTEYWKELVRSDYFVQTLLPAALDGPVGEPLEFDLFPKLSPQSIQHAYYLNLLCRRRIPIDGHILDLGGGYGNFARIVKRLGHKGRYQIMDLPALHRLQRTYLDQTVPGHGVEFIGPEDVGPADLVIGTFSLSEMPMDLRDELEPRYSQSRAMFFTATRDFEGVDNVDYFDKLSRRLNAEFFKDAHRNAWFLICKR